MNVTKKMIALGSSVAIAGLLTFALPAFAATFNVGGGTCDDSSGSPAYCTIQAAIDAASTGDIINVAAGTYSENIVLNKDVTLNGAQAGVDARGRAASESVIAPASDVAITLKTGVAGATIDGFTISGGSTGIVSDTGPIDNITIQNNIISGFTGSGIFLNDNGTDVTVNQNVIDGSSQTGAGGILHLDQDSFNGVWITNNTIENAASGTGFFVDGNHNVGESGDRSPKMTGNLFQNNDTGANLGRMAWEYGDISGNTFKDNIEPGLQGGIQHSTIENNTFDGNGRGGLELTGFGGSGDSTRGAQYDTVTHNIFTDNGFTNEGEGIILSTSQYPGTIGTNVINRNSISGNADGLFYGGTETINATCNWWGAASGPSGIGPGTGDTATSSATIDYSTWLTTSDLNGACNGGLTPSVTTDAATSIGTMGSTLNGTNGPVDASNTSFWWGTSSISGLTPGSNPGATEFPASGWSHDSGLGAVSTSGAFDEALTGLAPNTTYYFVAWAYVGGIWYPGQVLSFTTESGPLPSVTTNSATAITTSGATLNGTDGPVGADNTSFWWGDTAPSGPITTPGPNPAATSEFPSGWNHDSGLGAVSANGTFNESLSGLTPGDTYYFLAWVHVDGTWYPASDVLSVVIPNPAAACPDGTVPSASPVETVAVNANSSAPTPSSNSLSNGQSYLLVTSGTWDNTGGPNLADAMYASFDSWTSYQEGQDATPYFLGPDEFNLEVDGAFANWGPYDGTNHTYSLLYTGTGNPASFLVFDGNSNNGPGAINTGWYGDNSGSLSVAIYSCTPPTPPAPPANACSNLNSAPDGYTLVNGTSRNERVKLTDHEMYVDPGGNNVITGGDGDFIVCTGNGNDRITLGNGAYTIDAGGGNNVIRTGNGDGAITTGNGNDNIVTGAGNHAINASGGNNVVKTGNGVQDITTGNGNDNITIGTGASTIDAGGGNNNVKTGDGNQEVTAGSGNDHITTGSGNDTINAGNGNNVVNSGSGDDSVTTGSGNDRINAGAGTDTCVAGSGHNVLISCENP